MLKKGCSALLILDLLILALLFWDGRGTGQDGGKKIAVMALTAEDQKMAEQNKESKRIALTFDDGPHPYYTGELLKGLKDRGVRATFFVTGENVVKYKEIIEDIFDAGHLIGNHTYHHTQLTSVNETSFLKEIADTNSEIKKVTGEDTLFIRPPYGSWKKEYEKRLNMFPVLWNIDPLDWCSNDADSITRNVVTQAEENAIILMHDSYPATVTAALRIVDILQKEGYEFVTVEDLLLD